VLTSGVSQIGELLHRSDMRNIPWRRGFGDLDSAVVWPRVAERAVEAVTQWCS
jgi:hypothetical protein